MTDLAELAVAAALAVAVNLVLAGVAVLCVMMVPVLRTAVGMMHDTACRIAGGGFGFVGNARPRRRPQFTKVAASRK
jgi:uracil phosphoribosyltransferase